MVLLLFDPLLLTFYHAIRFCLDYPNGVITSFQYKPKIETIARIRSVAAQMSTFNFQESF